MAFNMGALQALAKEQMTRAATDSERARQNVRDSFSTQRGIVANQVSDAARRGMARRGIDVNSEYGQRYLSELQGARGDALAAQEAAALSRIRDNNNLGFIAQLLGQAGNLENQRQQMALRQEQWDFERAQAQQAQREQDAARLRAQIGAAEGRVGVPVMGSGAYQHSTPARPQQRSGGGYSRRGGGGGAMIIGDPNPPKSPWESGFASASQTRLRDMLRNTGASVGQPPVRSPGLPGAQNVPSGSAGVGFTGIPGLGIPMGASGFSPSGVSMQGSGFSPTQASMQGTGFSPTQPWYSQFK